MINRQIRLAARPNGIPRPDDFALTSEPVPQLENGQFLVRNLFLGLAPATRIRMSEGDSYAPPTAIGGILYGQCVGRVIASRNPEFQIGDMVHVDSGWQEYSLSDGSGVFRIDTKAAPASAYLGVLGASGMTAYVGLLDVGRPAAGETVVVSAAAGAVGSAVGQIAKLKGCRVVGIAGGAEKCAYAVSELGLDACLDHRSKDVGKDLTAACPNGIDVYFENVGGNVRDSVWPRLNIGARVAICGLIAEYNAAPSAPGPNWMRALTHRITIQGFMLRDRLHRRPEFLHDMQSWLRDGRVQYREDITEGLENAPSAFIGLLQGHNFGKAIIRLAGE